MVTDNGNDEPIPADMVGRALWAAKHFGVLTVVGCVLWWQGNEFIHLQREERREQGMYMRETLAAINAKTTEVIVRANVCMENQLRESELTRLAIEKNTAALIRLPVK